MPVVLLNPEGLPKTEVYRQVAIATGTRQIHIAGQVSCDAQGQLVAEGDLAGQVAQACRNVSTALAAAGASFKDVVRLTFYVVDWKPEQMPDFLAGIERVSQEVHRAPAPATLIGVSTLFAPGYLVEIEATAVAD
ncbi:RidA family protein [Myxococcus stipitatus]|uniref:RidA family protein n=1 Tax=Myxococcus stipitatus TaxID=83455 RepID=UPI00314556DF